MKWEHVEKGPYAGSCHLASSLQNTVIKSSVHVGSFLVLQFSSGHDIWSGTSLGRAQKAQELGSKGGFPPQILVARSPKTTSLTDQDLYWTSRMAAKQEAWSQFLDLWVENKLTIRTDAVSIKMCQTVLAQVIGTNQHDFDTSRGP